MQAILTSFWIRFLHPLKYRSFNLYKLSFSEIVLVSWIFGIIWSIYGVLLLNFSILFNKYSLLDLGPQIFSKKWYLYGILFDALLFPIWIWLTKQIWSYILNFFNELFNTNESKEAIEEVLNNSFSSSILMLVPFIGKPLHQIVQLIYIYLGLRNRLLMSRLQSLTVLCSPLIFIAIFFMALFLIFMVFILLASH